MNHLFSPHRIGRTDEDVNARAEAIKDALGSVRAEGLEPSAEARRNAAAYEVGDMTADEIYARALHRARALRDR